MNPNNIIDDQKHNTEQRA